MSNLEYATVYFSDGKEFSKEITNVQPLATLDTKNKTLVVSIVAELTNVASAVSLTLTKERWQKLAQEVQEMIEALEADDKWGNLD